MNDPNPSTITADWPPDGYEVDADTAAILAGTPADEGE